MAGLCFAAAQSASVALDVEANVARHLDFIDAAHDAGVQLLVFPELSLTGYELARMATCALTPDDALLAPLRERATKYRMTIVAGAPIRFADSLPAIGAITFHAAGRTSVYRKHFLHAGEEKYASPGSAISQVHEVRGTKVGLAVCADTGHQQHAHAAAVSGAELYLAGSLISGAGYAKDSAQLIGYAKLFNMGVLLANHAYSSGGYESAGGSAFWAAGGELIVSAPGQGEMLVIVHDNVGEVLVVDRHD